MSLFDALILGALQGVTEFLPVSSSGHLVVAREFMAIRDIPLLFDVLLHVSTLIVIIIVFKQTVARLAASAFAALRGKSIDRADRDMIFAVIAATVATGILGLGIESLSPGKNPALVGALFCVTGVILLLPRILKWDKGSAVPGVKTGLIVGLAQGLGVFPGISRAGITITASLGAGLSRDRAGEFAFLISIPAVMGALVLTLKDFSGLSGHISAVALAGGMAASFVVGFLSLKLLLGLIRQGHLYFFSLYLIPLGIFTLIKL